MYLKFTEHIIKFHVVAHSKTTPKITEKFIASLSIVKCYKIRLLLGLERRLND